MSQDLVKVGRIVGTHGYKGAVKVELLTDFPERFQKLHELQFELGSRTGTLTINSCSPYRNQLLIQFMEINSLDEAQQYRHAYLCVPAAQVYPLPEGTYYHFQLLGLAVEDIEKGYLGKLTEILETGANDVYVVVSPHYGEILIPAIKTVILEVDLSKQLMLVRLLPGLLGE